MIAIWPISVLVAMAAFAYVLIVFVQGHYEAAAFSADARYAGARLDAQGHWSRG